LKFGISLDARGTGAVLPGAEWQSGEAPGIRKDDMTRNEVENGLIESLRPYAPRLIEGPNFLYRRALTPLEVRYHESHLGEWNDPPIVVKAASNEFPPIPQFGEDTNVAADDREAGERRVVSAIAEFTVKYHDISGFTKQRHWTFERFEIRDPFVSNGAWTNEMIALSIFPDVKILKCRILYGFIEASRGGKYMLDGFDGERLRSWAQAMLDSAIERTVHRREGKWFIMRAKVIKIYHSVESLMTFKAYVKGLEMDMCADCDEEVQPVPQEGR
jgi:hypothetical protein